MTAAPDSMPTSELDEAEPRPPRRAPIASIVLSLLALGVAAWVAFDMRSDFAFWFSHAEQVDLGSPGAYKLDLERSDTVAKIAGSPGGSTFRFSRFLMNYDMVAVKGTNVLVVRRIHGESAPDKRPFTAIGRLVRDDVVPAYSEAYSFFVEHGDTAPRDGHLFVIIDGELPRKGFKIPGLIAALLILVAVNVPALIRAVRAR